MKVRLERVVPRVAPRDAAAWWSDFREGATDHAFFPASRREIVERGPDHVTMREVAARIPWEVVTAWPGEREVRFRGRNRAATFDGAYRFEEAGDGTRIVLEASITLARPLRWTDVAAKPLVLAILKADLAGHARELARDLRSA